MSDAGASPARTRLPAAAEAPSRPPGGVGSWRWPLAWAVAGALAFTVSRLLAAAPALAEAVYGQRIGPALSRPLSLVTGAVPFAVVEVALVGYALWLAAVGVGTLLAMAARTRPPVPALAGGARRVLRDGGALVVLFYVLWGFNYARPPLDERLGWPGWDGTDVAEVTALARAAVDAANREYLELHGVPDTGAPTRLPDDLRAMEAAVDAGWAEAAAALGLPASLGARHGRVKLPVASPLIARLSIHGVYSPFTAEATVVRGLPAARLPFSMAHEKAHQRGIAGEAEASFLGFVATALSPDPLARYSAAIFAQEQLVWALPARERREVSSERLPGVVRDLADLEAYRRRNTTAAGTIQSAVNDRYLRANRVPGGVQNYGHAARLLVVWARQSGGELVIRNRPPREPERSG